MANPLAHLPVRTVRIKYVPSDSNPNAGWWAIGYDKTADIADSPEAAATKVDRHFKRHIARYGGVIVLIEWDNIPPHMADRVKAIR